jgi:hypothetical protein
VALVLGAPRVALGQHPIDTPEGHHAEDHVVHDAATEARLNRETKQRSAAASRAAAAAVAADRGQVGEWGPVVDWPVVGIHVSLLPNGKVLAFDSVGDRATETFPVHDFTRATVYDPATGTPTRVDVDTGHNITAPASPTCPTVRSSSPAATGTRSSMASSKRMSSTRRPTPGGWTRTWLPAAGTHRSRR